MSFTGTSAGSGDFVGMKAVSDLKPNALSVICRMGGAGKTETSEHTFADRHIGPDPDEVASMLRDLGCDNLDALIDAAIPKNIRLDRELNLPQAKTETEALAELR